MCFGWNYVAPLRFPYLRGPSKKASEDMMTTIKENAENAESNYKLVFAMLFFVVIVLVQLAVAMRFCYTR